LPESVKTNLRSFLEFMAFFVVVAVVADVHDSFQGKHDRLEFFADVRNPMPPC
jgi:hypothetical protein